MSTKAKPIQVDQLANSKLHRKPAGREPNPSPAPAPKPPTIPKLPEKVNLLVVVFTYSGQCHVDVLTYTHRVAAQLRDHPRVNQVEVAAAHGYPTDRVRNAALLSAKGRGFHFCLMIDDDMAVDFQLGDPNAKAVPFAPTALDFMLAHKGPCFVGAPYTSGPPNQEVVVMKNRERFPDQPDGVGFSIDKYTRDEAAVLEGIHEVAALPTGCLMIDVRSTLIMPPPWFAYEYADAPLNANLASTEDVFFTRNAAWLGVKQYCAWSSWCGHHKRILTNKPRLSPVNEIPDMIYKAWDKGWRPDRKPEEV